MKFKTKDKIYFLILFFNAIFISGALSQIAI